jgi:hypothetical protein
VNVEQSLQNFKVKVISLQLETFLEIRLNDLEERGEDRLLRREDGSCPEFLWWTKNLFHCTPEPAKFLIVDAAV